MLNPPILGCGWWSKYEKIEVGVEKYHGMQGFREVESLNHSPSTNDDIPGGVGVFNYCIHIKK